MFAVCVTFMVRPEALNDFLPLMEAQARNSVAREPQCYQFDVCVGPEARVFLYEIYEDAAAFELHLQSEHFVTFDAAVADMIEAKTVETFADVRSCRDQSLRM